MLVSQIFNKKIWLVIVSVCLVMMVGVSTVAAQEADPTPEKVESSAFGEPIGYVLTNYLNVRSGPGTNFGKIGQLYYSEMVYLTGRNYQATWVTMRSANSGQEGWVSAQYLDVAGLNLHTLRVVDGGGLPPTPTPPGEPQGYVWSYHLNVRSGPGLNHSIVHRLNRGESVTLLARNSDSSWLKIRLPYGGEGWVSAYYINSPMPIYNLPIENDVPNNQIGRVTAYYLNVRSGPSTYHQVIASLRKGDQVYLHGRNASSTWVKISLPNGQVVGWVSASYIWTQNAIYNLPVVQ